MLMLAAFKAYVFRLAAQDDLVVGIPAAGQLQSGLENLVGHCVNLLPVRSQLSAETSFVDYLKAIRSLILGIVEVVLGVVLLAIGVGMLGLGLMQEGF